jgi:hypothetical protein
MSQEMLKFPIIGLTPSLKWALDCAWPKLNSNIISIVQHKIKYDFFWNQTIKRRNECTCW